jgi:hypothetical protein
MRVKSFLLLLLCALPLSATVPVTGHLKDLQGNPVAGSSLNFVRFELVGCSTASPQVQGIGTIDGYKADLKPDATGTFVNQFIYGNNEIACSGTLNSTQFKVTRFLGGREQPGALTYTIGVAGFNFDNPPPAVDAPTITPAPANAVLTNPTGAQTVNGNYPFALQGDFSILDASGNVTSKQYQAGYKDFALVAAPGNPAAGFGRFYVDTATGKIGCVLSSGTSCAPGGGFYQTLQNATVDLVQRAKTNFQNGITCSDDNVNVRTNCQMTVPITGTPDLGKIPIGQGNGTAAYADPQVQGLFAEGNTTAQNPVAIGGFDTAGTPGIHGAKVVNATPAGTEYGIVTRPIPSGTQTVAGTVSANLGTLNGAALDATLTGGTQKAIARGGQKGTTNTNADITHTPSGANHEGLDVALYDGSGNQLGLSASPVRTDPTGTTTQPVSGTVTANVGTTNGLALDTSVNGLLNSQGSTTSGQKGPLVQGSVTTASPTYTNGQTSPLNLDTGGNLRTVCSNCGGGSGGTAMGDTGAFTQGTTSFTPIGGEFNSAFTSLASGQAGTAAMTADRALYFNLHKIGGSAVTLGSKTSANSFPVVIASDQGAVPVSGTVTANAGTGTFNNQQSNVTADYDTGAGTQNLTMYGVALPASGGAVAGGTATNPLRTDPTGTTTQPVSGTVTANVGTTNGLALDATLTGGTTKAINRGGAKGTSSAADVTSTASGVNHQGLDVALYDGSGNQLGLSASPVRTDPTGTTTQPVGGVAAAGSAPSGNPVLMGGSDGSFVRTIKTDAAGATYPAVVTGNVVDSASNSVAAPLATSGATIFNQVFGYLFNGTTWDRVRSAGATGVAAVGGAAANGSAVAGNPVLMGGSDGTNARTVTVKAASTAAAAGDTAVVAALSPNNTGLPVNLPSLLQKTSNISTGSVASLAKAFASNNTQGNSIVVVCGVGNGTAPTISDSNGNTYKQAAQVANGTALNVGIFVAVNIASGANTVTVNNGGTTASIAMEIYEVPGLIAVAAAQPDNAQTGSGTSATASTSSNLSPLQPNEYAFSAVGIGTAAQTITAGTGWTNDSGQLNPTTPAGLFSLVSMSQFLANLNSVQPLATFTSEPWAIAAATFRQVVLPVQGSFNLAWIGGSPPSFLLAGVPKVGMTGSTGSVPNVNGDNSSAGNGIEVTPALGATAYPTGLTAGNAVRERVGKEGLQWTASLPALYPASFSASATVAPAASATDISVLPGVATASTSVLVTRIKVSCTQTTAGIITLNIIKRSTADTAGTSSAMTVVPDDSAQAGTPAAPLTYTANPTTGTAVGNVDTYKLGCLAPATAGANDVYILNRTQKPIVLRGTAQQLAVNLGGVTVTGGSFTVTYEWIETTTP